MRPELDDEDRAIIADRMRQRDEREGARVGDFVIFACGTRRRVSHVWPADWHDDNIAQLQTSDAGSYYLGPTGGISMSGSLYGSVGADTLTEVEGDTCPNCGQPIEREGWVWIFHHDHHRAHNGIDARVRFRVFTCTERAPR